MPIQCSFSPLCQLTFASQRDADLHYRITHQNMLTLRIFQTVIEIYKQGEDGRVPVQEGAGFYICPMHNCTYRTVDPDDVIPHVSKKHADKLKQGVFDVSAAPDHCTLSVRVVRGRGVADGVAVVPYALSTKEKDGELVEALESTTNRATATDKAEASTSIVKEGINDTGDHESDPSFVVRVAALKKIVEVTETTLSEELSENKVTDLEERVTTIETIRDMCLKSLETIKEASKAAPGQRMSEGKVEVAQIDENGKFDTQITELQKPAVKKIVEEMKSALDGDLRATQVEELEGRLSELERGHELLLEGLRKAGEESCIRQSLIDSLSIDENGLVS
ncbi:hypothetical protein BJ508DRAFT_335038 [Ascobolus immersus RN42]|uniref:Uncharacterized protein n=1 Tax=Ascobolus immersus RN42 TaxID=1160509 RepID=A0A3N4HE01_ASCIM|nr:hypothetical protein BJ508DRAFT_335038 [Ascobolus immersus RN42]